MRIHDVILTAPLEPATGPAEDPYQHRWPPPPTTVADGDDEYEIEKLILKRRIRRGRGWSTQVLDHWYAVFPMRRRTVQIQISEAHPGFDRILGGYRRYRRWAIARSSNRWRLEDCPIKILRIRL
ncbi:hypothetical protein MMC28_001406 [Mycoblastus sanguinarius]|nr:hypothetical protein [Mycoblastus sanguinarius]